MSVKASVKRVVRDTLVRPIRKIRDKRRAQELIAAWKKRVAAGGFSPLTPSARLLMVPADQNTIFGSRGEDAMITGTIGKVRSYAPGLPVDIIANGVEAISDAKARGYTPHSLPETPGLIPDYERLLKTLRPVAVTVVGADVIDGHYGEFLAAKLLIEADIAARYGISTTVLGFSLNATAAPCLAEILDNIHPGVAINVRDPISMARFQKFTKAKARMVADSAFMLVPNTEPAAVQEVRKYVDARHAAGRKVIIFNIHPLFSNEVTQAQIDQLVEVSARAIEDSTRQRAVSWLLLPHDYRGGAGDAICLRPLYEKLKGRLGDDVYYMEGKHTAATLKGMAAQVDGVITGRMHLAIGALGSGVPTAGITYQDKFEGLYQHFGLPDWLLVPTSRIITDGYLIDLMSRFIDEIDSLRVTVGTALPAIKAMSEQNLSGLAPVLTQHGATVGAGS